jgi:hypothetical protein
MEANLSALLALPASLPGHLLLALAACGCAAAPSPAAPEADTGCSGKNPSPEPPPPPLPEGDNGIAAGYPGDIGIEKDPAVVFHDDFEDCRTVADLHRKWTKLAHEGNLRIAEEPENVHSGRRALEITMPQQQIRHSVGLEKTLSQEQDVLFLRFYAKLQEGFDVPLTSVHNGGGISAGYWRGESAGPGKPSDGRNKFLVNYEPDIASPGNPPSPGPLNIYIYHPEQRSKYGDHFYPTGVVTPNSGLAHNFGPHFVPRRDFIPKLGRWYCYEFMLKANTPGLRDGRVGCWVDGKLIADFLNLRLRDIASLKIDLITIGIYIADNSRRENKKWHDDVVAATSYIGPQVSR